MYISPLKYAGEAQAAERLICNRQAAGWIFKPAPVRIRRCENLAAFFYLQVGQSLQIYYKDGKPGTVSYITSLNG
jgi:hypothetical protein